LVFSHHSLIITLTYNAHCSFLRLCLKRAPGEGRGGGGTTFRASHLWPDSSSSTMQSSWVLCQTQNSSPPSLCSDPPFPQLASTPFIPPAPSQTQPSSTGRVFNCDIFI
jgi:hypothetical protein